MIRRSEIASKTTAFATSTARKIRETTNRKISTVVTGALVADRRDDWVSAIPVDDLPGGTVEVSAFKDEESGNAYVEIATEHDVAVMSPRRALQLAAELARVVGAIDEQHPPGGCDD